MTEVGLDRFSILNILPNEIHAAVIRSPLAGQSDALQKLVKVAYNRTYVPLSQFRFASPEFQKQIEQHAYGPPPAVRFVEMQNGDPIPDYAELLPFGFPLGRTMIVVPSFYELARQNDATILKLLVTGNVVRSYTLEAFVAEFERGKFVGYGDVYADEAQRAHRVEGFCSASFLHFHTDIADALFESIERRLMHLG